MPLPELSNKLTVQLQGDVRIFAEGSGENIKYYAQSGADAASKKLLGSNVRIGSLNLGDKGATHDIDVGFTPSFFIIYTIAGSRRRFFNIYWNELSETTFMQLYFTSNNYNPTANFYNIGAGAGITKLGSIVGFRAPAIDDFAHYNAAWIAIA